MVEQGAKGKKPPSFPHVHPSRARKFKKAWVEKAKIKSRWKAEKKKEGLMEKAKLEIPQYEEQDDWVPPSLNNRGHSSEAEQEATPQKKGKTNHQTRSKNSEDSSTIPKNADKAEGNGVRELMRKAYSKSNLHTFKSDPLKKRAACARSKGEKGKGQPDMKLRMNALLAKIKQDYT